MTPWVRNLLIGLLASASAVWIGSAIAEEQYFWATLFCGLSGWLLLSRLPGVRAETWVLAFLVVAYVLGNRGFAQVTPIPSLPLFFGELGLIASGALVVWRAAFMRSIPLDRNLLSFTLLGWMALAAGRIVFDVRDYGIAALRDFATVYYAGFYFISAAVARDTPSRRVLHAAATLAFSMLPIAAILTETFPLFFQQVLVLKGVPIFYYKGDLLATFLLAGYVWLLPREHRGWRNDGMRWVLALLSLLLGLGYLSRAGMVGFLVVLVWMASARWWRPVKTAMATVGVALLFAATFTVLQERSMVSTKAYAVYEHLVSIADFSGTRTYQSSDAVDSGDNNQFRLIWWKMVVKETIEMNPLIGLGFGHDLARGFIGVYYPLSFHDFTARSPHSIIITIFGRMGMVGLTIWLAFVARLAARTWAAARRLAMTRSPALRGHFALLGVCWIVLVSACFGVVLEGPMGAIPFWILLGWASLEPVRPEAEEDQSAESR